MLLSKWLQQVGIFRMTGWRLRKESRLKTITRYGRIYVTAAGNAEFFQDDGSKPRRPLDAQRVRPRLATAKSKTAAHHAQPRRQQTGCLTDMTSGGFSP
jgi:hypothetical protein